MVVLYLGLIFSASAQESEFKKGCRQCHNEVLDKWDMAEVKHFPYREQGCESCHALEHKKFTAELGKPCVICHDLASVEIKKGHFGADVTGADCFNCHYTHGSDRKGLLKEEVHTPFGSGMCDVCHKIGSEGKIETKAELKKTCLICHANIATKEDKITHAAYELFECTSCHSAHTATYDGLLNKELTALCLDCHGKNQVRKHPYDVRPSEKITYSDTVTCVSCHRPHAAKFSFLLKDSLQEGKLCYNCHKKEE
jgi:predicted CXXCH cytochrome family protein